jgi:hypothetical protein
MVITSRQDEQASNTHYGAEKCTIVLVGKFQESFQDDDITLEGNIKMYLTEG